MLPAEAEKDAKCLTLSLLAANVLKNDPEKMKSVVAESWYFMGRMDSVAPDQDLKTLLPRIVQQLQRDPHTKELGPMCDALFLERAAQLRSLGQQSEKTSP